MALGTAAGVPYTNQASSILGSMFHTSLLIHALLTLHYGWPHSVIFEKEGPNDGLVSVESSKWVGFDILDSNSE